ncbi:GAF domain-containing protein [Streptomyces brasiliscabiei]|uniref:GAF domain-containing protein n=1 Tax=Streptomyces brasiliscabiei TaxID=2736302 RepID=A0ABU8GKX1_9ACTN
MLVTQSGFQDDFLDHFAVVRDKSSVCGQAVRQCAQVVVADVRVGSALAPHQRIFRDAGVRAVQSTPLVDRAGNIVGMLSTHASQPGGPPDRDLRIMELYGRLAGDIVAGRLGCRSPAPHDGPLLPDTAGLALPGWSSAEAATRDALSDTVNRIFSVGLDLAGALQLIADGDPAGQRVRAGLGALDEAIRSIQRAALDLGVREGPSR